MAETKGSLRLVEDGAEAPAEGVDSSGVVASGQSEHKLLEAGKISLDEYMDMAVDRALSHLVGQISSERYDMMRDVLRQQLETDPHLASLVERVAERS